MEPSIQTISPPLTPWEADVIGHTARTGRYVTDEQKVIELGKRGLLHDHGPQALAGGMHYLTLTGTGRDALMAWREAQPKPPPISKRKQRSKNHYREYLANSCACESFAEYLTGKTRKQLKKEREAKRESNQRLRIGSAI